MGSMTRLFFRDLRGSAGQMLAISFVALAGMAMLLMAYSSYRNLDVSLAAYYEEGRFMDYLAVVGSPDGEAARRAAALPGVEAVSSRATLDVAAALPGGGEATLRLIGLPAEGLPGVNVPLVAEGRLPAPGAAECLLDSRFAKARGLSPGATILLRGGDGKPLAVTGLGSSPDCIYMWRSGGTAMPAPGDYGALYVRAPAAAAALGGEPPENEIAFRFEPGADAAAVIAGVEAELADAGFVYGARRAEYPSDAAVRGEIGQMETLSVLFPVLFVGIASAIIFIMMRRMVAARRSEVGTLKSFGYSDRSLLARFVAYPLLACAAGCLPGALVGHLLGTAMTGMYAQLFSIPTLRGEFRPDAALIGFAALAAASVLASWLSVRKALAVRPAEAMRPEAPRGGRRVLVERIGPLWRALPFRWKLAVREAFRNRQRAALNAAGFTAVVVLIMVSLFFLDSLDYVERRYFDDFAAYDAKLFFEGPVPTLRAKPLGRAEGVARVEPLLEFPAAFSKGGAKAEGFLTALPDGARLLRFVDESLAPMSPPATGLMLDSAAARLLGAVPGDTVRMAPKVPGYGPIEMRVESVSRQFAGFSAYVPAEVLAAAYGVPAFANAALVELEPGGEAAAAAALKGAPFVASYEDSAAARAGFRRMVSFFGTFVGVMVGFGALMGFSIALNAAIISVAERRRELATLRALGYGKGKAVGAVFREIMVVAVLSAVPGLVAGRLICEVFARQFSNEMLELEAVVYPATYAVSLACAFGFALLALLAVRKRITSADIGEALKCAE